MSTNRTLNPTSYPITRRVKPMSIGKCVTLAAAATIGVGTALGLADAGSLLSAPAAAIAPGSTAGLGARTVAIAFPSDSRSVTMQVVTAPASGPGSIPMEDPCATNSPSPPSHPGQPGDHPPLHGFALHPLAPCGTAGGTVKGPGGGGSGNTGENPGGGGGGGTCVGDEITCHQPF